MDARPFDARAARDDFPILAETAHGRPLVYLDNAATTQRPRAVLDAVARFERTANANVHRGVHELSRRATEAFEAARRRVARFLGAPDPKCVVFTRGTTEGLNLVAHAWAEPRLRPGDEIAVSESEHHSNLVPWQLVAARTGARLVRLPVLDDGRLDLDAVDAALGARTRVVAVGHVSNALGTVHPVAELAERAHAVGAVLVVDGAQAAPHLALDVGALGCDFYAFSGHKMYAPMGIGALYGRPQLLADMAPWQGGGEMIKAVRFESSDYADPPARFEAGTPNAAGAVGLAAAMDYLDGLGRAAVEAHERALHARLVQTLGAIPGVRLVGTAPGRIAVQSFVVEGAAPHEVAMLADQHGVALRSGHHCTQPLMQRLGLPGTLRASLGLYTTDDDLDALGAALAEAHSLLT